jgi:hypothetical protein
LFLLKDEEDEEDEEREKEKFFHAKFLAHFYFVFFVSPPLLRLLAILALMSKIGNWHVQCLWLAPVSI